MECNSIIQVILYLWLQLLMKTKRSDDRFGFLIFNSYHNIFGSYFTQYVLCCSLCNALQFAGRLNSPTGSASEVMTFCLQWPCEPYSVMLWLPSFAPLFVDIHFCVVSAIYWYLAVLFISMWPGRLFCCTRAATVYEWRHNSDFCVRFRYGPRIP